MTLRLAGFLDLVLHGLWAAVLLLVAYGVAMVVPVEAVWFRPGDVVVADTTPNHPARMDFHREIAVPTKIQWSVVVRSLADGDLGVYCEATGGPHTYPVESELPDVLTIAWWTDDDPECTRIPPGAYVMETCWTVVEPFFGLVPPKTTCRTSNVFHSREE